MKVAVGGEKLTFVELSRRTGIARPTLQQRWRLGKREQDLTTPVDRQEAGRRAAQCRRAGPREDLNPEPAMTYEEIAAELKIDPCSVYRIERMALAKIRRRLGL